MIRILIACLMTLAVVAPAQERRDREVQQLRRALEEIAQALEVARDKGQEDRAHALRKKMEEVEAALAKRGDGRGADKEKETVKKRIRTMRFAVDAFVEKGNKDAAHRVEQAMHARELLLAGKREGEAARIIERAPGREELSELLAKAAHLYEEWGKAERSHALARLAETYAEQARRRRGREGESERGRTEDAAGRRLEHLAMAYYALKEGGMGEAARAMEQAIAGYRLQYEAQQARRKLPSAESLRKLVGLAIESLQSRDRHDRAEALARWVREGGLGERRRRERDEARGRQEDGRHRERSAERREILHRMEQLERRLHVLKELLEETRHEMEKLRRHAERR